MNSGKMESSPGDFPGFRRLRAAASSSGLRVQRYCDPQVLESSIGGKLLVDEPGGLKSSSDREL